MSPSRVTPVAAVAMLVLGLAPLAACDMVPPPAQQSAAARKAAEHKELRNAIEHKAEREKAAHAADPVLEADKARDKQLEDSGG